MTMEIIKQRRSIRRYESRPVEEEKLRAVLEAARLAPSWANRQCWTYIVIKDQGCREAVASTLKNNPAARAVATAPVLIVACADPEQSGKVKDQNYYLVDIGISLQQLCLEAQNQRLGTVWIGWIDEDAIKSLLGVPEGIRIVAMTPLGYPAVHPTAWARKPLEEIVYRERWGNKWSEV